MGKRPSAEGAKQALGVLFDFGGKGLPKSITTEWHAGRSTVTFTSWGRKTTVKAPS